MALCKRRGFIYQASEIYGGINGFWDYGPLGAQLKKNLRDAWWEDMVMNPCGGEPGPNGEPVRIVPLDTSIIQHPQGLGGERTRRRLQRSDGRLPRDQAALSLRSCERVRPGQSASANGKPLFAYRAGSPSETKQKKKAEKAFGERASCRCSQLPQGDWGRVLAPDAEKVGTLTEPRAFNLMFKTYVGATATEDDIAYLRPETAQGIFVQFKNVVDTTRVKVPFGIAQIGKAFRNEVTPRNFTFRCREFEQMEMEFFCHPDAARDWYAFWRDAAHGVVAGLGLGRRESAAARARARRARALRERGCGHQRHRIPLPVHGARLRRAGRAWRTAPITTWRSTRSTRASKLEYFDNERGELLPNGAHKGERYLPHVIEPAAGLDRGVLALLCEAYTEDPSRASPELLLLHPRVAPDQGGRVSAGQQGRHAGDQREAVSGVARADSGAAA